MRLIIEKIDDVIYVYKETEKHYKSVGRSEKDNADPSLLDNNCDLTSYPEGTRFVFRIKKAKKK